MRRIVVALVIATATLAAAAPALARPTHASDGHLAPSPADVIYVPNQHYGPVVDLSFQHHLFDAYLPTDIWNPHPGVILIHGGGARSGDKSTMAEVGRYLAQNGLAAFSINYRPVKEGPEFTPLEDVQAAVAWIRENAGIYSVDPTRIGAVGTSAGAHLVSLLATKTDGQQTQGSGVTAVVAWSPFMDLVWWADHEDMPAVSFEYRMGCSGESECRAIRRDLSPITFVGRNDAKLYFVHSRHEFIPVAMSRRMDRRMDELGARHTYIELPGGLHGLGYLDEPVPGTSTTVLNASLDFLLKALSA